MEKKPVDYIEDAEEVVVEIIKAPFKIADRLWGWVFEGEN